MKKQIIVKIKGREEETMIVDGEIGDALNSSSQSEVHSAVGHVVAKAKKRFGIDYTTHRSASFNSETLELSFY